MSKRLKSLEATVAENVNNGGEFQLHNKFGLGTEQVEKQNLFCASSEHPIKEIKAR